MADGVQLSADGGDAGGSARIGRTTGHGIAGNLRRHYAPWIGITCIALLLIANVINLGADPGAMGDVAATVVGGPRALYIVAFGAICVALQVLIQYARYVSVMKWLTVVLLAYFGTMMMVRIPWNEVAWGLLVPTLDTSKDFISIVAAVLGTTISPYLFFWQSSQEAEDQREQPQRDPLVKAPEQAPNAFTRIRLDTMVGMGISSWRWRSSSPPPRRCMATAQPTLRRRSGPPKPLDEGFHLFEEDNGFRWTNGDARIPLKLFEGLTGAFELELHVASTMQYPLTSEGQTAAA